MQYPNINKTGTVKNTLLAEYKVAGRAVADAITALHNITVHGRDYYLINDSALAQARAEHFNRINRLQTVYDELVDLYTNISEQGRK